MSRFFFDVDHGDTLFVDTTRAEFSTRELAQREALSIAFEIARDEFDTLHGQQSLRVRVRDIAEFYRATLTIVLEADGTVDVELTKSARH